MIKNHVGLNGRDNIFVWDDCMIGVIRCSLAGICLVKMTSIFFVRIKLKATCLLLITKLPYVLKK